MIYVSKEKAEFYSGDGYSGMGYPMTCLLYTSHLLFP